ncbi:hypothetical protein CYJ10_04535 [Cupriavidus pauculus]|uniref:Chitin-binding type-3 domain-containing protein n=1 Tax=Cupriavidus pauculus TaxID=82633 RepID=A0A2N5CK40_9BURK|nr:hypothetical protein CYJ10_04535 [Cupriavidus pauculus]
MVGTKLTFRALDAMGRDAGKHVLTITAANAKARTWAYQLAQKVNVEIFRIGELQARNGASSIVPPSSVTANRVYLSKSYPGYRYEIDKEAPSASGRSGGGSGGSTSTGQPDGSTLDTWREGPAYEIGKAVTYQGKGFVCLQRHTALRGAGWAPAATPALWRLIR